MEQLIKEYYKSLEKVRQALKKLIKKDQQTEEEKENLRILRSMENDLLWTIEWLESGQQPQNRRCIKNRATYQREIFWSQLTEKEQRQVEFKESQRVRYIPKENKWLEDMLSKLSKSEYEAFVAVRGEGLSFAQTASLLHCSKSTVQSYVRRAERKLSQLRHLFYSTKSKMNLKSTIPSHHEKVKKCQ